MSIFYLIKQVEVVMKVLTLLNFKLFTVMLCDSNERLTLSSQGVFFCGLSQRSNTCIFPFLEKDKPYETEAEEHIRNVMSGLRKKKLEEESIEAFDEEPTREVQGDQEENEETEENGKVMQVFPIGVQDFDPAD